MNQADADSLLVASHPAKGDAAVAVLDGTTMYVAADAEATTAMFEAGSLTKPMTTTLLAALVLAGEVTLDTTVGEILGSDAGATSDVSLRELATHSSGLPRLAVNAMKLPFWPRDPYRFYGQRRLYAGLRSVALEKRGSIRYSNLGFQLLGQCLATAVGRPIGDLLTELVFQPAGMEAARCQPCAREGLVRGHGPLLLGGRRWTERLPGAGGVDCTIIDLARWVAANTVPESTPLEHAVRLCHQVHATDGAESIGLGWHFSGSAVWHNGGTGSFQGVVAFVPGRRGACGLAASGHEPRLDDAVLDWIWRTTPFEGDPEPFKQLALTLFRHLTALDFQSVRGLMRSDTAESLTEERLHAGWMQRAATSGDLGEPTAVEVSGARGAARVTVVAPGSARDLTMRATLDDELRVTGLVLK